MLIGSKAKATTQVSEFIELLIGYLKQETIRPVSRLGRYVLFGVAGSIFVAGGTVLLVVGLLRLLQGETGSTFTGNLDWLPYVISAALGVIVAGAALSAVMKKHDPHSL